jgi:hypothetical protein
LIENPDQEYPAGSKMSRVAAELDYYLPFRQCAPTMKQAMDVLYSNCDHLLTSQGFANVLAFRGIFYGSDFARDDFQYFNSREEWDAFYHEKEAILGSEEKEGAAERQEKKKQKDAAKGKKKKTKSAKQVEEEEN